jgi:hypothetical protein
VQWHNDRFRIGGPTGPIIYPTLANRGPVVERVPIPDTNPVEYYTDRIYVEGLLVFAAQGVTGETGVQGPPPTVTAVPVPNTDPVQYYADRINVGGVIVFAAQGVTGVTGATGTRGVDGATGASGPKILWPMFVFGA